MVLDVGSDLHLVLLCFDQLLLGQNAVRDVGADSQEADRRAFFIQPGNDGAGDPVDMAVLGAVGQFTHPGFPAVNGGQHLGIELWIVQSRFDDPVVLSQQFLLRVT